MPTNAKPGSFIRRVREVIRVRQLSYATEKTYVQWIKRFIKFNQLRHPRELGAEEVSAYLTHLATNRAVNESRVAPRLLRLC